MASPGDREGGEDADQRGCRLPLDRDGGAEQRAGRHQPPAELGALVPVEVHGDAQGGADQQGREEAVEDGGAALHDQEAVGGDEDRGQAGPPHGVEEATHQEPGQGDRDHPGRRPRPASSRWGRHPGARSPPRWPTSPGAGARSWRRTSRRGTRGRQGRSTTRPRRTLRARPSRSTRGRAPSTVSTASRTPCHQRQGRGGELLFTLCDDRNLRGPHTVVLTVCGRRGLSVAHPHTT